MEININTFTVYKKHHRNKYIYIYTIYTLNYALKCTMKYITTAYTLKLLNHYFFQKKKFFFSGKYKMVEFTRKE